MDKKKTSKKSFLWRIYFRKNNFYFMSYLTLLENALIYVYEFVTCANPTHMKMVRYSTNKCALNLK